MFCNRCGKKLEMYGLLCKECTLELEMQKSAMNNSADSTKQNEDPVTEKVANDTYNDSADNTQGSNAYAQSENTYTQGSNAYAQSFTRFDCEFPEPDNRMYGFGKALASTILSTVGFFIAYIALIATAVTLAPGTAVGGLVLALPPIVISFIMGISSIRLFSARKQKCKKPVATLVLGIVGTSLAAFSTLFCFILCMIMLTM